jgi:hypothetical protein
MKINFLLIFKIKQFSKKLIKFIKFNDHSRPDSNTSSSSTTIAGY